LLAWGRSGSFVVPTVHEPPAELALGLSEGPGQVGELRPTEQHEHEDEDDQELWRPEIHGTERTAGIPTLHGSRPKVCLVTGIGHPALDLSRPDLAPDGCAAMPSS
jgi:hypothetical protein